MKQPPRRIIPYAGLSCCPPGSPSRLSRRRKGAKIHPDGRGGSGTQSMDISPLFDDVESVHLLMK
jgi:hypothetical protein